MEINVGHQTKPSWAKNDGLLYIENHILKKLISSLVLVAIYPEIGYQYTHIYGHCGENDNIFLGDFFALKII
jgi:hypothetical protein